jgi:HflK protein
VVHYRISKPDDFLFRHMDGAAVVRTAAESVLQGVVTRTELDGALTVKRREIEDRVAAELQQRLDRYQAGAEVLRVRLIELHPAVEVVDAFREVSGAFEEKNRLVNEAEGYRNEQVALARGRAEASLRAAAGYAAGRKARAAGDAGRFEQFEAAFRQGPQTTETRLYLETMEQILPGKRKMIVDATRARRHLLLMEDGVELAPGLAAAGRPAREEER